MYTIKLTSENFASKGGRDFWDNSRKSRANTIHTQEEQSLIGIHNLSDDAVMNSETQLCSTSVSAYKVLRRIQQPQPGTPGQTPSLFVKCTGFFHYALHNTWANGFTSHPRDEAMVKCLAQGHKCHGWEFGPIHCWLETPEFEFGALNRSATTLQQSTYLTFPSMVFGSVWTLSFL